MKTEYEYNVDVQLRFAHLTPEEFAKLESYIRGGFEDKGWGLYDMSIKLVDGRVRIDAAKAKKGVTKEELLAAEKQRKA